jgi:F-type H+-transporting ATPase subunit b
MENNHILSEIIVQILGFAVVFWVLKSVAWSKLLGSIDARRKTIEDAFADIEKRKEAADALERDYRTRLERIEQEARAKIQEAAAQGAALSKDIQDKARIDAQRLVDRAQEEIRQDLAKARLSMRDDMVELSGLLTEKILKEKLDDAQHKKLVDRFIHEIEKV